VPLSKQTRVFRVKVCALHKLPIIEFRRYSHFQLEACIYHGGLLVSKRTCSPPVKISHSFFSSVIWKKWLNFGVPLSHLPRESRLCLTLNGLETASSTNDQAWNRTPVAWVIQKLFDSGGVLIFGPRLLGMWGGDEVVDPLDSPYPNTSRDAVLLELFFEDSGERVNYEEAPPNAPSSAQKPGATPSLLYRGLKKMADRDRFSSLSMEDEKLIWSNRFLLRDHLSSSPRGLPLLLLSTPHWRPPHRDDVWAVLGAWPCHDPVHGLELLDPQLADGTVRKTAVSWLSGLHDDDLCDFLPQLVQSLRHDNYERSAMAELLLRRAVLSPRVAHSLYWQLRILATGSGERYGARYRNMTQALDVLLGERIRAEFTTQEELVEQLVAMAAVVKATRDAHRQTMLVHELQRVKERMVGDFRLPLSPSLLIRGVDFESSSFFNSNTVPLKISFLNSDPFGDNIDIIFKVGDDLRQDILVLQMIKLMEKIWLRAGLDLKMVTYDCVATGQDHGMLEVVTDSSTLRAIQTERGVTGSFKDKPLSNWLMRFNTSETDYRKAVDNFTCSCAGYCVATYVLGICDRHNDNIMVKRSGHMFHIDFGKILGNAQMFGSIKRDRVPFVLTRDMAYVINDGDRPTSRFQQFVDLCCTAYNELRRHAHTLLSLLSLMLPSGLAELSSADDVLYVRDALLPGRSDAEATYAFTKHIEDSLGSMATQINFFIHNLAQLKFSSPQAPPTLLTFVSQAYSIETDGRISSAVIVAYYMKYYPDAHTVYQIQVTRPQVDMTTLFRRYREFDEFHCRLTLCFPGDELPGFPGKTYIPGKSRARETVERRLSELNKYISLLLGMEARIAESDVVYTFFHCLIRDEQEKTRIEEEGGNDGGTVAGKVKVHLMYDRKRESLSVMIRHVTDLVSFEEILYSYSGSPIPGSKRGHRLF
jgi:phosphatidylinositol-4-phosphate 3-kinase